MSTRKIDESWRRIIETYELSDVISRGELAYLSAAQIKVFHEPRLAAKFDSRGVLPEPLKSHSAAILPVNRSSYVVGKLKVYAEVQSGVLDPRTVYLPEGLETLSADSITSEAVALNAAMAARVLEKFTGEESLLSTISGRMGTGAFEFWIDSTVEEFGPYRLQVSDSQMEIDLGLEGDSGVYLVEAKLAFTPDFNVRQLYYPYRAWSERIRKPVVPIFVVYSNGIFEVRRYEFTNPESYSSISLAQVERFRIDRKPFSTVEVLREIDEVRREQRAVVRATGSTDVPFPQADTFERIVNLVELLSVRSRGIAASEIADYFEFTGRQADYYLAAAKYLGLVENEAGGPSLTSLGRRIMALDLRGRSIMYCALILSVRPFREVFEQVSTGTVLDDDVIAELVCEAAPTLNSTTARRRAKTVRSWVKWVLSELAVGN